MTSHIAIHGIEFETLTIDKQTILNEIEQQIWRFRQQVPVLNEGSVSARFLNERLQRQILEAHERLKLSVLSVFERFGQYRQINISW
jgi:limonene-1,2-epoxide hydrolase